MSTSSSGARRAAGWVSCCLAVALFGCSQSSPSVTLKLPAPRPSRQALGGSPVTGAAQFDAPIVDPNAWTGSPVGTGGFQVATAPSSTGGPSSIAANDSGYQYVIIGDFTSGQGTALAVVSDLPWAAGTTNLDGVHRFAVLFDVVTGASIAEADSGTLTLTAAGAQLGQRVTGSLSGSFVDVSSPPGCQTNADCARGEVCQSGVCIAAPTGCTSNAQCAAGQVCVSGQCVLPPPACVIDSDCASGEVCQAGTCVTAPAGCATNAQCATGEVCISGQCVLPPTACVVDSDCSRGEVCQSGTCVVAPTGCTSSAQCAAGQVCLSGQCVLPPACVVDADCASGEICSSGMCVAQPTGCTSNAQCAPGQVCTRGQCTWTSATCAGQQGGGGYSGAWGGVAQCSAAGTGSVAVSGAQAWIDDSNGQLALIVADPASSSAGVVIALSACPSAPATVTLQAGEAMLYAEMLGAAPDTELWLAKQASGGTLTFSSVGAVTAGSFQLTFSGGGTVTGSFTVQ